VGQPAASGPAAETETTAVAAETETTSAGAVDGPAVEATTGTGAALETTGAEPATTTAAAGRLAAAPAGAGRRRRRAMAWLMVRRSLTRRRSRVLIAAAAVAIGATTCFALAGLAIDLPRQLGSDLRRLGANLVVVAGDEPLTAAAATKVAAALDRAPVLAGAGFRFETVRVNQQPYIAAAADLAAARGLKGYWDDEGDWPHRPGEILVGSDVAQWIGLAVGDTVTVTAGPEADEDVGGPAGGDGPDGGGDMDESGAGPVVGPDGGGDMDGPGVGSDGGGDVDESGDGPADGSGTAGPEADGDAADGAGAESPVVPRSAEFTVVGVLASGGEEDAYLICWPEDLAQLAGESDRLDVLEYAIDLDQAGLVALAVDLERAAPGIDAGPVQRLAQTETEVLAMLRLLLGLIAAVVLVLTMIGVATTMLAVVTERRGEIALRLALGAEDRSIRREFLVEGACLGLIGGLAGVGLGHGLAQLIGHSVFQRGVGFIPWLGLATVVVSTVVAYLASRRPVARTARIDPAQVLREE
jgi:putative ABC transport system permease protein